MLWVNSRDGDREICWLLFRSFMSENIDADNSSRVSRESKPHLIARMNVWLLSHEMRTYRLWTLGCMVGTIIAWLFFIPSTNAMADTDYNIFHFELAWSADKVDDILRAWDGILGDVESQTYIDFAFLVFYGGFFAGLSLILAKTSQSERISRMSVWMVWASVDAAGLDALENVFLLLIVSDPGGYPRVLAPLMTTCAALKFAELFVVVTFLIVGYVHVYLNRGKRKDSDSGGTDLQS